MIVKSQLIEQLAKKQPFIEGTEVSSLVNLLLDTMTDALHQGGRIEVRGFGSFSLRIHKARKARNPKTGEKIVTQGADVDFVAKITGLSLDAVKALMAENDEK